ncbi:GntR family transcriptional regulator [Bacillus sp. FSL K6-3431]
MKNKIKREIQSGELLLGDRVLSEEELMKQFNISQITAKNALSAT